MLRFLRLWLSTRAFVTRYPGFLRLRGSPVFSLALYGIIQCWLHDVALLHNPQHLCNSPIRTKP
ncbi:hypothetical protein, partial [Paraburkholderia youngii]|uniref:hypothetical protein n=1 Tax=Paraburkholderia youngii TaxID=2782701 RepID=UPI001C3C4A5F